MIVLGLLAILTPALSLAAGGGGSAGDQQYTDPLEGTPAGTAKGSGGSSSTASTPSPAAGFGLVLLVGGVGSATGNAGLLSTSAL
jgi:hypothetical protein